MSATLARLLLLLGFIASSAAAQELTLSRDCEVGFRRFIQMAQQGRLGDDVTNANVSVDGDNIEIELVRAHAPAKRFRLKARQSGQIGSRYFDIALGSGASSADAERLGRALDLAFVSDPFVILGDEALRGGAALPGIFAAWRAGGWHGVVRVLERRMMVLASVRYTMAVTALLGVGVLASLLLLWLSEDG
jgi:hypothetical protein